MSIPAAPDRRARRNRIAVRPRRPVDERTPVRIFFHENDQNLRTHLAGRRDPDLRRRWRLSERRLDRAVSHPRRPGRARRHAGGEFRSADRPSHLRSMVGILAKSAEQPDGGRHQSGNEIHRYAPSGKSRMGPVRSPRTRHRRGHPPHQVPRRPRPHPVG